jgi:PEGA domain
VPIDVALSFVLALTLSTSKAPTLEDCPTQPVSAEGEDEASEYDLRAKEACQRGKTLALEMNIDAAIASFETGVSAYERSAAKPLSLTSMSECLLEFGAVLVTRQSKERALDAFKRARILNPSLAASPRHFNPEVVALFRRAVKELDQGGLNPLHVVSAPPGARVALDGVDMGRTPLTLSRVLTGKHWLSVELAGYERFVSQIQVGASHRDRQDIFLRPLPVKCVEQPALASSAPVRVEAASNVASAQRRVPAGLAILPFGIGQFIEHRPVSGALWLSASVALMTANVVTASVLFAERRSDQTFDDPSRARALQAINIAAFTALLGVLGGGSIDGYLHR